MPPLLAHRFGRRFVSASLVVASLFVSSGLSGCIVAGYSSRGGLFVWPGGFGLLVLLLLL